MTHASPHRPHGTDVSRLAAPEPCEERTADACPTWRRPRWAAPTAAAAPQTR